jgi:hypothetical protein
VVPREVGIIVAGSGATTGVSEPDLFANGVPDRRTERVSGHPLSEHDRPYTGFTSDRGPADSNGSSGEVHADGADESVVINAA